MKKLLQINVTANWGSTGKIAEQIGQLVMRQGWESYIAYGRMMNPSKSKLIKIGSQWDVYLHYAMSRFFDMEGLMSQHATRKFLREIEQIKPDIIHLHNIHDHYLHYRILFEYLKAKEIPVVWTQHDQWATTGHCAFNMNGCIKWKTECHDCPARAKYSLDRSCRNYHIKKRLFTNLYSLTIIPVSEWLGREIKQSFLNNCPMRIIKNGVDVNVFSPQTETINERYGLKNNKIILGVATVWDKGKRLEDYIKLSSLLSGEWIIVLVGTMDERDLPGNIIHIPRTQNQSELALLYSGAHVLLSLSASETFGLTIAEAMACGTPAIVYNNTAQPELITDETGFVVNDGDINEVYRCINRIDKKGRCFYRRTCRDRAELYLDKNRCYKKYLELYEDLIHEK